MFLAILLAFSEATDSREPPVGFTELAHRVWLNPPRLKHVYRFPPRVYVQDQMFFNREHHLWLQRRQATNRDQDWEPWIKTNQHLYEVFDALDDAQNEFNTAWSRRLCLLKLQDRLGPENWYIGRLPPPVPLWLFKEN